jgi:hypothetical protein
MDEETKRNLEKTNKAIELVLMKFINLTSHLEKASKLTEEILGNPILQGLDFPDLLLVGDLKNFLEMSLVRSIALRNLYRQMLDIPESEKKRIAEE